MIYKSTLKAKASCRKKFKKMKNGSLALLGFFALNTTVFAQTVSTIAGSTSGYMDGVAAVAQFQSPGGVAYDSFGNLFVADRYNNKIRKIDPSGNVTTFAGSLAGNNSGFTDGTASSAEFNTPMDLCIDDANNLFVVDYGNNAIRKITPNGDVTTHAGGTSGTSDGMGTAAQFSSPFGITVDDSGNLFVCEIGSNNIRRVEPNGNVTTFAGTSTAGTADGPIATATFSTPTDVYFDLNGDLIVADYGSSRIRKISGGNVTTIAGSTTGNTDGNGVAAQFMSPTSIAGDVLGNLYVTDFDNHNIRKISQNGDVTTIAGGNASTPGYNDGAFATSLLDSPTYLCVDSVGNIIFSDSDNNKIRKIEVCPYSTSTDVQNSCTDYTWIDGNTYTTSNNSATFVTTNSSGCDSIITLDLTITTLSGTVNYSGGDLSVSSAMATTYQWVDCGNSFAAIPGATAVNFTPSVNGDYAVVISNNNCSDTTACFNVNSVGLSTEEIISLNIFPNPSTGIFTVTSSEKIENIELFDLQGRSITTTWDEASGRIEVTDAEFGQYILRITSETNVATRNIVINK